MISDEAEDIVLHYGVLTKTILPRTLKNRDYGIVDEWLIEYSKRDIMNVINLLVRRNPRIYSFNYIVKLFDDTIKEVIAEQLKPIVEEAMSIIGSADMKAVESDDESATRNKLKSKEFGIQSRLREKFNFDLLKTHR